MVDSERCFGTLLGGRCDRRAAHHGHCAIGGSYCEALDERDDLREQLRGAMEAITNAMRLLVAPGEDVEDRVHDGYHRLAQALDRLGGQHETSPASPSSQLSSKEDDHA